MPLSKKIQNQRFKEAQIKKFGSEDAYKAHVAAKKKAYREKKKQQKAAEMQKLESKVAPIRRSARLQSNSAEGNANAEANQLAEQLAKLSLELKNVKIGDGKVPTVIEYVEKKIKPQLNQLEMKGCNDLSDAIYQVKLKTLKGRYKESTHKGIMSKLKFLGRLLTDDSFTCNEKSFEVFKDTKRVLSFINDNWSNANTRQGYVQALSGILRYIADFNDVYKVYSDASIEGRNKLTREENELKLSAKERKLWMSWDKLEKSSDSKNLNSRERAMIALFTLIPPRRLTIAKWLVYGTGKDKNYNYLNLRDGKIILNNYKTNTTYGQYIIKIPVKLKQILAKYIKDSRIKFGKPLFPNSKGGFYSNYISTVLSKTFNKAVGKPITAQILRHSYVVYRMKNRNLNLNQMGKIAKSLGHSEKMLQRYNRLDVPV